MKKEKCLFCEIVKKEIPIFLIHENDNFVAVLDHSPIASGHTLIISKECVPNYLSSDEKHSKKLNEFVKEISGFLKDKLGIDGVTLLTNNYYGQEIPHLHWHFLPRFEGDNLSFKPNTDIKLEEVANILSTNADEKSAPKKNNKKKN